MSATVIKFEVQLPNADINTSDYTAVQTFLTNMQSLGPLYFYEASMLSNNVRSQIIAVYGLLSASQASTALGYLSTLNLALGRNVPCISYSVNTQP